MTFAKRRIDLEFQLGLGAFGDGGLDTVRISGLRCSANISKTGGNMAELDLRVWGLPLDIMNKLTVLNTVAYEEQRNNRIIVYAGDEESGMSVCFTGTIREAWADGRNAPDVMFHIAAFSGFFETIKPSPPVSYKGSVSAEIVFQGIATLMGFSLENNGVTGSIENPYWPGSIGAQLNKALDAFHADRLEDAVNRVLAIWPKGGSRTALSTIRIAPDSGLVGYPGFTQTGVQFLSVYNPNLVFARQVEIESDFKAANKTWVVAAVSHNLDSNIPGGQWFTEATCSLFGQPLALSS
ncbi:hypothetical protein [Sphingomonas sp. VL_57B]|jgi:hypothetical protein|uniref:baseplate hub protein n=1 Tax=Sphingomonas sp. VL_57B TaxID=3144220 RepID=UPI0031F553C4